MPDSLAQFFIKVATEPETRKKFWDSPVQTMREFGLLDDNINIVKTEDPQIIQEAVNREIRGKSDKPTIVFNIDSSVNRCTDDAKDDGKGDGKGGSGDAGGNGGSGT